ncbi:MAG TPA: flagellar filament capping protein FliD [Pirellulales bacterium]|jgi:flagellar hook-associated protein 2|nr:flagellar filament capping protein FliD [Pirellulales bacterium]
MGTITAGIGLVSGINYAQLVSELVKASSGPVNQQTTLDQTYTQQQTAIGSLQAAILGLQSATNNLASPGLYTQSTINSSNSSLLSGTATGAVQPGTYQLTPVQVAQNQQLQSSKFTSQTASLGAGTLTFSSGGFVNPGASLDLLNGGNGFTRGEIQITSRSGASAVVDLRSATNIDDVLDAINNAGIGVQASTSNNHIVLTDTTGQTASNLKVQEVGGGTTAASLGLAGINTNTAQGSGNDVLQLFGDIPLSQLNDGNGLTFNNFLPDLQINFRDGTSATVDFNVLNSGTTQQTLNDVINTINSAAPGKIQAAISPDGSGITLTDLTTDDGGTFSVSDLNGSSAKEDLGLTTAAAGDTLTGQKLLGGLKTVLLKDLNGGAGLGTLGSITTTDRNNQSAPVDLSSAQTLDDVINDINDAGIGVQAQVNDAGNGIEVVDTTGDTASNLIIANADATNSADKLGLTVNSAATSKSSGNLHLQTVSESTLLSSLNGGDGVGAGSFKITDTTGESGTLTVGSKINTVGDLLQAINALGLNIDAHLNAAGDGIALDDTAHGPNTLSVTSTSGTTAQDLHLLGGEQSVTIGGQPTQEINGSQTLTITLGATDTLQDLANDINNSGYGLQATILNNGSSVRPYQLSLFNSRNGQAGEALIDTSGVNFSFQQTVAGQDAKVVLGSLNAPSSILATSATNTVNNLVPGLSINVGGVSQTPITLSVAANNSNLVSALQSVVTAYNTVHSQIKQDTTFNITTNTAAVLQADNSVLQVNDELANLIAGSISSTGSIHSLAQLGITIGQDGTAAFNQSVFQATYNQDPQAVQDFLTTPTTGVSDQFKNLTNSLAGVGTSILAERSSTLAQDLTDGQQRITLLNSRLNALQQRLTAQFQASELAIAKIQSNLSAIQSIQPFQSVNTFNQSSSSNNSNSLQSTLSNITG